jgi:hypothetical protein
MQEAKHTQERLELTSQDDQATGCANFESRYGVDAVVLYGENAKADARRIVQCWNAHDLMFEALEVVSIAHKVHGVYVLDEQDMKQVRAAIAAASPQ